MKSLKESMNTNEAREISYRVCLLDLRKYCKDEENFGVTILVDASRRGEFEKFLEGEQDNIFIHASGGGVEY